MKLGLANMLQKAGSTRLSDLPRIRGQWTDAGRSAPSLSMDWQVWGTKGGLCWRATRDGLRHVPASPPKSPDARNQPRIASRGASQRPVYRRFPAPARIFFLRQGRCSISTNKTLEIAAINRNWILSGAPSAGAGKNALFSSRGIFARGVLGLPLGLGFAHLIPTHQVTRGNQSKNPDC